MADRVLKIKEVVQRTGTCRSAVYYGVRDGSFPAPVRLGRRSVGWLESSIDHWLASRPRGVLAAPCRGSGEA
jgi:prophage regulatory protein